MSRPPDPRPNVQQATTVARAEFVASTWEPESEDRVSRLDRKVERPADLFLFEELNAATCAFPASYRYAKRALDLLVASLGLVVFAPILAVLALLVRLDSPGPAFFVQVRVGQHGKPFSIIKLRTMLETGRHEDGNDLDDADRVTRVGRYLRRWSLDELPQLINVMRGDMSLVGPRPELPEIVRARYERWQYARFSVPQGMTGWWQVTGRGHTRLCDDISNDLTYLERASFWFDLKILALTIPAVIRQAGLL